MNMRKNSYVGFSIENDDNCDYNKLTKCQQ